MTSGQHRQQGTQGDIRRLRQDVGETAEELSHRLDAPTRARAGAQQAMGSARETAASIPPSSWWAAAAAATFAIAAAAVARKETRTA
jgi:hypothetical protein